MRTGAECVDLHGHDYRPYGHEKVVPWTCLQAEEWTAADDTFKVHKSKLELAKEEAAATRSRLTLFSICVLLVFSL